MAAVPSAEHRRRTVLRGVAAAGLAGAGAAGLGACGPKADTPSGPAHLGSADQVPVGGSALFREDEVVVGQPRRGEFKAFSAVCTHQGCVLASLRHNVAGCPCHGSEFDALTGAVVNGPATKALPEVAITVQDGKMITGS